MKKSIIALILILSIITFFFILGKRTYTSEKVIISEKSSSFIEDKITISMKSKKGYKIYYTLDGSNPNKDSFRYKKSISINRYSTPDNMVKKENIEKITGEINIDDNLTRGTILRAIAIAPDGTKGPIETRTYFVGENLTDKYNNVAVFSIVTDPSNLLDYNEGIMVKGKVYDEWSKTEEGKKIIKNHEIHNYEGNYTQKGRDWEREAIIELFDGSNNSTWQEKVGIRVKGNISRMYGQKSLNIYFRKEYGNKNLDYKLFDDAINIDGEIIKKYKGFTLRNGGNDTELLKFKDQWLQDLVKDRNVDTQSSRIAIVFLNGEYWGVYNLQEKYTDLYYAKHYNIDKDNVVVIKEDEVEEGKDEDIELYNELMDYCNKDMTDPKIYNEFKEKVDMKSLLDYYAIEIYIGNADWGIVSNKKKLKNTQLWRVRKPDGTKYGDGKWRWSLYDLEYSSSMYNQKETSFNYDSINRAIEVQPLFASLMKNEQFKNEFYKTLKEIGNNNFTKDKVEASLDAYNDNWNQYMIDYYRRFGNTQDEKEKSIDAIKEFFKKRYDFIINF